MDAGSDYEKAWADEVSKLERLYGGGDLTSFPEFKFTGESTLLTLGQAFKLVVV